MGTEKRTKRDAAIVLPQPISIATTATLPPLVAVLCASLFGPQPLAWLWVGSQVEGATESLGAGLAVAFAGSATTIMLTAWVARRLDWLWVAVRRGAGRNPKGGLLEPAMVLGTALVVVGFAFWFLVIEGPGPSIAPRIG